MNIVYFTHSLRSDWNHGNAHFVRGVLTELQARGHQVTAFEPNQSWSAQNLVADCGPEALEAYRAAYPGLQVQLYDPAAWQPEAALADADLVIVHEWNDHSLVAELGRLRTRHDFRLLFHDTHHRAVSAPGEMGNYDLSHYDGVLAFGNIVRDLYLAQGWTRRAWTWHEAADVKLFHPLEAPKTWDLIWVGNWGDDERVRELHEFLIEPVRELKLKARIHGVRYPDHARAALREAGLDYAGYLPNYQAPLAFAQSLVTVHVPRGPYVQKLHGIPTIRPFEAMACGIPLVSAPWYDTEELFRPGVDYLVARDGNEMKRHLRSVLCEPELRQSLISHGLETICARHTCGHRAEELLSIAAELN